MRTINWISLLVGIILISSGTSALCNPSATFLTLAIMLGVVSIVHGIMLVIAYFWSSFKPKMNLVLGILLIIGGLVFLFRPYSSTNIFAYIVAIWFIVDAINNLILSDLLKLVNTSLYRFSIIINILILISGIVLLFNPLIPIMSVSLIIGLSLLAFGIDFIIFVIFDPRPIA
jgi:Uncharacterized conserved protein